MLHTFSTLLVSFLLSQWTLGVTVTFDDAIVIPDISSTADTNSYYGAVVVISPSRQKHSRKSSFNKGKGKKGRDQRKSAKNIVRNDDGYYVIQRPSLNANVNKKNSKTSKNRNDDGYYVVARPPTKNINHKKNMKSSKNNRNDDGYFVIIGNPSDTIVKKNTKSSKNRNDDGYVVIARPTTKTDDIIVIASPTTKTDDNFVSRPTPKPASSVTKTDDDFARPPTKNDYTAPRRTSKPVSTDDVVVIPKSSSNNRNSKDYNIGIVTKTK